jgi:hypothetical protein
MLSGKGDFHVQITYGEGATMTLLAALMGLHASDVGAHT